MTGKAIFKSKINMAGKDHFQSGWLDRLKKLLARFVVPLKDIEKKGKKS
jgi:hypothetical protein